MAAAADRHILYQKSVQNPEGEVEFMTNTFKELRGREARVLREDFCGTAFLATEWCRNHDDNKALGVDLCEDTLNWGRQNNIDAAGSSISTRVQLIKQNVLDYYDADNLADIVCAFNFSYNILKPRQQLIDYFKNARRGLADDGILVLDIFGGTESYDEVFEPRSVGEKDFNYIWDQRQFNPITHDMTCFIHFKFRDGSFMPKAFEYSWRLRTIPELIESLYEAGYSKVRCYWEEMEDDDGEIFPPKERAKSFDKEIIEDLIELDFLETDEEFVHADEADDDDDDDSNLEETGRYVEVTDVENQASWISYIVAER